MQDSLINVDNKCRNNMTNKSMVMGKFKKKCIIYKIFYITNSSDVDFRFGLI